MYSNTRRNPNSLHVPPEIVPPALSPSADDRIDRNTELTQSTEDELQFADILSPKSRTVGVVPWARVSMAPQYNDSKDIEAQYVIENESILEIELNKKVESYGSFE